MPTTSKGRVVKNVASSLFQVVVSTIVIFILFKFLVENLGPEKFGLWSVIISAISIANLASLGFSTSITIYVAKFLASREEENALSIVETSFISVAIITGAFILLIYPASSWILSEIIIVDDIQVAIEILPFALLSFWFFILLNVLFSVLDGLKRIDIRSLIQSAGLVLNLLFCFIFVPKFGLKGVAFAQLIQSVLMIIIAFFWVKRFFPNLPLIPYRINKELFFLLVRYSTKFQLVPLSQLFCEPATKILLAKFGGLATVSYFDMANRMLSQIRVLFSSASQVLLPIFSEIDQQQQRAYYNFYKESVAMILYLSISSFLVIVGFLPIISFLWIGHYEKMFVFPAVLLSFGFLFNTIGIPAYYFGVGFGNLRWIIYGHIFIAIANIVFGYFLGHIFGYLGVVYGWIISWVIGTGIFVFSHHRKHGISLRYLISKENILLTLASLFFAVVAIYSHSYCLFYINGMSFVSFICFLFVVFFIWNHSQRLRIISLIKIKS